MVYIHADSDRKRPQNFDAACCLYGALDHAQDTRLTSFEEVASGKFDTLLNRHLFAGSVDFMQLVFSRAGKEAPSLHNPFQKSAVIPLAEVRQKLQGADRWFLKPVLPKLFTGMVFDCQTISQLASYPAETEILIAKPFDTEIVSEVRCYVHLGKIIDARHYAGDFRIQPDYKIAADLISGLADYPIAYTLDVGVLASGKQVVIELNDMWAIGNYGMENALYYTLLFDRYFEIMA